MMSELPQFCVANPFGTCDDVESNNTMTTNIAGSCADNHVLTHLAAANGVQ